MSISMEFCPFYETSDEELNQVYKAKARRKEGRLYNVEITINGLNDGLIVGSSCTCQGFFYKKKECIHIKSLKDALTEWGIELRDTNELSEKIKS